MAATLNEDERKFASTLSAQEIPSKLRCALCNLVAVDAVKLPCCETSICAKCQAELPDQCSICEHQPLSPDVCTPMKSLRMTIKAHLKTELKRRSAQASATPAAAAPTPTPAPAETPHAPAVQGKETEPTSVLEDAALQTEAAGPTEAAMDDNGVAETIEPGDAQAEHVPDESINQENQDGNASDENAEDDAADEDTADKSDVEIITERPESEMQQKDAEQNEEPAEPQQQEEEGTNQSNEQMGFGFNQNEQGFPNMGNMGNMDFNSMNNFNPMMAMQGMGMPGFGMGMPNMMGMPGMMDPSMMNMMNNSFGGMGGMNGMMGLMGGGFDAMSGMGMNGFGGGYNRFGNNYNSQQPFHPNARGFNRPYGRGGRGFRGAGGYGFSGRGRGGFNQFGQNQGFPQNGFQNGMHNGMHNGMQPQNSMGPQNVPQSGEEGSTDPGARRGSPSYEPANGTTEGPDDSNIQPRQADAEAPDDTNQAAGESTNTVEGEHGTEQNGDGETADQSADGVVTITGKLSERGTHIEQRNGSGNGANGQLECVDANKDDLADPARATQASFDDSNNQFLHGNPAQASGYDDGMNCAGMFPGPNSMFPEQQMSALAPPVNAPTGPKAMRQGLPNSGFYSRPQASQTPSNTNARPESGRNALAGPGSVRGRSAEIDDFDNGRGREASCSRSRSKHIRKRHSREDDAAYESETTYERRKERERRKRKERERERRHDNDNRDTARSSNRARSRSASPNDDSSSRRDRHRHREARRERSRDKRKASHRNRSPDDHDAHRGKSSRSHRHDDDRSRRTSRRDHADDRRTRETAPEDVGFKIKGSHSNRAAMPPPSSSRRDSERRRESATEGPATATDPYAAERERHKLERAKAEQARRQSSQGQGLGKRGREEGEDVGGSGRTRKEGRRRISAKYEGEIGDGEREREMGRWR